MDLLELKPFPAVAANNRSTLVTDELVGRCVLGLAFEQGGTTFNKSHLSQINIRAGGKDVLQNISGARLTDLNEYDGFPDVTNYLFHWFGDPTARTVRGQWLGALDMSVYRDNPLEVNIDIGGATAPTLKTYALVGPPKLAMGVGFNEVDATLARSIIDSTIQPSGAVNDASYVIGLGSQAGARIRKIAFFHTNLTSVNFKKAGDIKHDRISNALNNALQQQFARVPQSGVYVLDRIVDGNQGEAETTLMSNGRAWPMQVRVTTSGGDTITAYADLHTALPLL